MERPLSPIAVRPWTLNGLSERLIVSHYEQHYGGAVRTLDTLRRELASLDARSPGHWVRALKREELLALGSMTLHELYFANLGGDGNAIPVEVATVLEAHFGSVRAWRDDFIATARSLDGGPGWILLTYSRREARFWNQIAFDHAQAAVDSVPVLALDLYEHAYALDFGGNATAYIDAFMRNIAWAAVGERMTCGRAERALPLEDASDRARPSMARTPFSVQGCPCTRLRAAGHVDCCAGAAEEPV